MGTAHTRIRPGLRRQNARRQWYTVIGRTGETAYAAMRPVYEIEFGSGFRTTATSQQMYYGKIRDKGAPSLCGVGITGWEIEDPEKHPLYHIWHRMIRRCYTDHVRYRSYRDVTVCRRWHRFPDFVEDAPNLPGYDLERIVRGELTLDKDQLGTHRGIRMYSPDTCIWADANEQAAYRRNGGKTYAPQCPYRGVHWTDKGWIARAQFRGEKRYLGYFQDPLDAARVVMDALPDYYLPEEVERILEDSARRKAAIDGNGPRPPRSTHDAAQTTMYIV
jgi:hypothetical protein